MHKKIIYWGGYGGFNLGDEAILYAMSRAIRAAHIGTQLKEYVLLKSNPSSEVDKTYKEWGLETLVLADFVRLFTVFRKAFLIIGGGQLVDNSGLLWPVGWSSSLVLWAKACGARVSILGIGAEQVNRPHARFAVRNFYSLASKITVRDEESANVLTELGIQKNNIEVTADWVFSLSAELMPRFLRPRDHSVVLIVSHDSRRLSQYTQLFQNIINAFTSRDSNGGICLKVLGHDVRKTHDAGLLDELKASSCPGSSVQFLYPRSFQDACDVYSNAAIVISARMHPIILGMLCGAAPVFISGTPKLKSLQSRLRYDFPSIDSTASSDDIAELISAYIPNLTVARERFSESINILSRDAVRNTSFELS